MTRLTTLPVVLGCLLLSPAPLSAHHAAFYSKVIRAIQKNDLASVREHFTDSAWEGADGGMSAAELGERLRQFKVKDAGEWASFDSIRSRCGVRAVLQHPDDENVKQHVWVLARYVGGLGNIDPKAWQAVRIVDDDAAARSFLASTLSARVFPMEVGHRWVYAGDDKEMVFEVLRTEKRDKHAVFVVRRTIGESPLDLRLTVEKDGVDIHQAGTKRFEPSMRPFAFGVKRDDPWTWSGTLAGEPQIERFENIELGEVAVPAGSFFVIGVRQSRPATGGVATFSLADGIGIVQMTGRSGWMTAGLDDVPEDAQWSLKRFEPGPRVPTEPVKVKDIGDAQSLAPGVTSVSVVYTFDMRNDEKFAALMKALARHPDIRHLTLRLPNSSHVKEEGLEALKAFRSLETLDLLDSRDGAVASPSIFEQVAAMRSLRRVRFEFHCRSPSEPACMAALRALPRLESAAFSDGRDHLHQGWEDRLTRLATEVIAERKAE